MLERLFCSCMLRPEDVRPSHDDLEVVGTFNPGAIAVGDEVVLLVRVAERPRERREGLTGLPRWEPGSGLVIDWADDDEIEPLDPRVVSWKDSGLIRLTTHVRRDYRDLDALQEEPKMETLCICHGS